MKTSFLIYFLRIFPSTWISGDAASKTGHLRSQLTQLKLALHTSEAATFPSGLIHDSCASLCIVTVTVSALVGGNLPRSWGDCLQYHLLLQSWLTELLGRSKNDIGNRLSLFMWDPETSVSIVVLLHGNNQKFDSLRNSRSMNFCPDIDPNRADNKYTRLRMLLVHALVSVQLLIEILR